MNKLNPLIEPIGISTTFVHQKPGQMGYGRVDNPTRLHLEKELARLENARFALAFSSGSAALAAVFSLLNAGDTALTHNQMYEGTERMLNTVFKRFDISQKSIDLSNKKELKKWKGKCDLIMCESITNPCLKRIDLERINANRERKALLVVDNTIASPICISPLTQGADIVVHSLTKWIGGHHDVIAGAIMTNNQSLFSRLCDIQWTLGAIPSPHDCALVLRGIQTLSIRMRKHQINATRSAQFLKKNKSIIRCAFPGISGLVSFWIRGDEKATIRFLMNLKHIKIAHSFGGTQSTVLHPRSMMSFTRSEDELNKQQITGNLVRLSVGIEEAQLIIDDLKQALES